MKIALINENSQAGKNCVVETALKKVVEPMGHEVLNYGMYTAEDAESLTYVQNGILAAVLLNSGAADFVVTGCGTGEGALVALNAFPGVICGHAQDPVDAFLFSQINAGNALSMPFAKGFGWAGELNLEYIFEKLFGQEMGIGYPKERAAIMAKNRGILKEVKAITHTDMVTILQKLDQSLVKGALGGAKFKEYFYANATDQAIIAAVKAIIGE